MTDQNPYQVLLNKLNEGRAILTAGKIHPDVPTIHDVGSREGAMLRTDTPVDHAGFGLMVAKIDGDTINFDAGGAMNRIGTISYTTLRTTELAKKAGYDFDKVRAALETKMREWEDGQVTLT